MCAFDAGTGIDVQNATVDLDETEVNSTTWGNGTIDPIQWTFNTSGAVDPVINFTSTEVLFGGSVPRITHIFTTPQFRFDDSDEPQGNDGLILVDCPDVVAPENCSMTISSVLNGVGSQGWLQAVGATDNRNDITLGDGTCSVGVQCTDTITLATDSTGDAEVTLPAQSISGTEITNDTIGPTQVDETANYTWTGDHSWETGNILVRREATCLAAACDAAGERGRLCVQTSATLAHELRYCAGASGWVEPAGTGGTPALSAITAAIATNSITNAEFPQTWTWDTAATTVAFDPFTFALINDSTTDGLTQEVLMIQRTASAGTQPVEALVHLANLDTDGLVNDALLIDADAGAITDAVDASDPEIVNAISLGANSIALTGGDGSLSNTDLLLLADGSITLPTETDGVYVGDVAAGTGIAVTGTPAENYTETVAFDFSDAGTDPALGAEECRFSNEGVSAGGWVCEGTADLIETRFRVTDPTTTDKVITFPNETGTVCVGQTGAGCPTTTALSSITAAVATNSINNAEFGQVWTWDSAAAAAALDGMTFGFNHDATSETANPQQGVVVRRNATAGTQVFDALVVVDNADTDGLVTDGVLVTAAAGAITDALDVADPEVVNGLNLGNNNFVFGSSTWGNGGAFTLTFDAGASDPLISFGSGFMQLEDGVTAGAATFGDNLDASMTWTYDTSGGSNPALTFSSGVIQLSTGVASGNAALVVPATSIGQSEIATTTFNDTTWGDNTDAALTWTFDSSTANNPAFEFNSNGDVSVVFGAGANSLIMRDTQTNLRFDDTDAAGAEPEGSLVTFCSDTVAPINCDIQLGVMNNGSISGILVGSADATANATDVTLGDAAGTDSLALLTNGVDVQIDVTAGVVEFLTGTAGIIRVSDALPVWEWNDTNFASFTDEARFALDCTSDGDCGLQFSVRNNGVLDAVFDVIDTADDHSIEIGDTTGTDAITLQTTGDSGSTITLTNMTTGVELTSLVSDLPFECVMLDATAAIPDDTAGCGPASKNGTNFSYRTCDFDTGATEEIANFVFELPVNLTSTTGTIQLVWSTATTCTDPSDDVCWTVDGASFAPDAAFNTGALGGTLFGVTQDCSAAGNILYTTSTTFTHGMAPSQRAVIQVSRDTNGTNCAGGTADDDLGGDAFLHAVRFCYRVNNLASGE